VGEYWEMRAERPFSRRQWMSSLFLGAAGVRIAQPQQECTPPPSSDTFSGVIGRTAAESKPAPLEPAPKARPGSPNIIYILLDDTGLSDLHCYGSEVATPHIDALAAGGLLYNNFHSKAIRPLAPHCSLGVTAMRWA
jgi:hypothetical protein